MRDPYRPFRGATLLVNLRSGVSLEGVVVGSHRGLLELGNVKVYVPGANPSPADGPCYTPHREITYVQRVYPAAEPRPLVGLPEPDVQRGVKAVAG